MDEATKGTTPAKGFPHRHVSRQTGLIYRLFVWLPFLLANQFLCTLRRYRFWLAAPTVPRQQPRFITPMSDDNGDRNMRTALSNPLR